MIPTALGKESIYDISRDTNKNFGRLVAILISIIGLTIFQDFLESNRSGYSFYFSESILFKTIWILFIPLLVLLSKILKKQNLDSLGKTTFFIVTSIITHLVILPFVFLFFSVLFYNGRYDIYKILTYTLANDLYKLVIVYSVFVFVHRYLSYKLTDIVSLKKKSCVRKIIISNGKNNTVIEVNDIYQITAETPYISIELEGKKYLQTATLKSISTQLDHKTFVRVHKSTIVNMDKVVSLKSRLNGDYDLFLKNDVELRLSRTYVANFKSNFKNAYQVKT
ncbi:LytR/AlgR family response regulator transcription factor [Patiriisocius sp. Uisw_017]|jgi:hypothetical protein|uniref:LytR/AlgR family response regulator transcription factor n=1 Tax=Patiriisocius sp. Uisw_017 TaxID=3230968 RepID=UPI0039E9C649